MNFNNLIKGCIFMTAFFVFSSKAFAQIEIEAYKLLQGKYDNLKQAESDTAFRKISLIMHPIWEERKGELWLYVEQAIYSKLDKPYRQRVYKVFSKDGKVISEVYNIKDPLRFAGCWKQEKPLSQLTPDSLEKKIGCEVILTKTDKNKFSGQTGVKTCPSELYGASYATSEVSLDSDKIVSWDRGYSLEGKQVWGSEVGGYIFVNRERFR
jgi:hypothetical protein